MTIWIPKSINLFNQKKRVWFETRKKVREEQKIRRYKMWQVDTIILMLLKYTDAPI